MKRYFKIPSQLVVLLCVLACCLCACKKSDRYREPGSADKTKPGIVTNVRVQNLNGAAVITYSLPDNENLLYVQADYDINNGINKQSKSSYFLDTIRVEGFHSSKDYTVTLRAVTRSNVQSDPVTVTVHPDTPYYQLVRRSIALAPDFGGLNIQAENAGKSPIGLNFVAIDPALNRFTIQNQRFTSANSINYSVRGYRPESGRFGVFVTDQFGNSSDTALVTLTPLYEELFDKSKFFNFVQPSDALIGYGGVVPYLWDGLTLASNGAPSWATQPGTLGATKRMQCTFGLGRVYKLSHFLMYFTGYGYDNPKNFTIYGSNTDNPADAATPGGLAVGTTIGDWTVIGNYRVPDPPSGLQQGSTNAADQAFLNNGIDFNVPFDAMNVKYIRIVVKDTWFGSDYTNIREISMYGAPQ
jgi:hypothetical protein